MKNNIFTKSSSLRQWNWFDKVCENVIIPFSTVDKQKNPIYGVTKPFFGFLIFLKCCM